MNTLSHQDKLNYMIQWANENNCTLQLAGNCGFGRECVGIIAAYTYPDYQWYDTNYKRADLNGEVWTPEDAYHKHECVAVLGRGESSESQLYDWLKWFSDNNFKLVVAQREIPQSEPSIQTMISGTSTVRMIKQS